MNEIAEIARRVILAMAKYKVPMCPENYFVWYEGLTGKNEELAKELYQYQASGIEFTEKLNRKLYEKYFGYSQSRMLLKEISEEAGKLLREFLEKVSSGDEATKEYAGRLKEYLGRIERAGQEPSELKKLLQDLVLDTRRMEKATSELRDELKRAQKQTDLLHRRLQDARREAILDVLTGLYNRRYLDEKLKALYQEFLQNNSPFSVILMDIDHFKKINDTHGHQVGDGVLEFVGASIKAMVKGRDVPVRYGGEEFAILLPHTSREGAYILADNIRAELASKSLKVKNSSLRIGTITVSLGVAQVSRSDTPQSLIKRADQALYLAKVNGRNQVKSEKDLQTKPPFMEKEQHSSSVVGRESEFAETPERKSAL